MLPDDRPNLPLEDALALIAPKLPARFRGVCVVGVRGYYLSSQGEPDANDRGLYDDGAFVLVVGRDDEGRPALEGGAAFNFNTDPSRFRAGTPSRRGMAVLTPGLWRYKLGVHGLSKPRHRRYRALVQAAPVTVDRDGPGGLQTAFLGINVHWGGNTTTGSLGCQTVPPAQWDEFISMIEDAARESGQREVPYLLVDETARRAMPKPAPDREPVHGALPLPPVDPLPPVELTGEDLADA